MQALLLIKSVLLNIRQHPGEVCPAKWKEGAETLTPSLDLVGKI